MPRSEFRPPNHQRQTMHPPAHKPQRRRLSLAPAEGWLPLLLLSIAVYSVVFSIISANWVSNSFILLLSTAAGLLTGLIIAKIHRFPQAILHLAACLVGYWLSVWLTSVVAYHTSWLLLLENLRSVISGGFSPAVSANSDVVFLFYLTFLCFFLGYFGSWLTYRAHLPWLVALVYCAIMLVNLNYIKQDLSYLVIILLGALILLIARIQLVNQLTQWINEGLHTDRAWLQNINRRFVQITSLFVLLVLPISWVLPILGQPAAGTNFWNDVDNAWINITHGQLPLGPGSLFQPYQAPANFFGDQLAITGSVQLPTGEVIDYTSSSPHQPQYLEGFTYDHFDGHTWTSSTSNRGQQFAANAQLPMDITGNYNQVTTTVTVVLPPEGTKNYIFGPAEPTSFNVPTVLYGEGLTASWTQQGPLAQGERYQVASLISAATAQDLSAVPFLKDNLNLWVSDGNLALLRANYLQKPNDLSTSVIKTAQQWTRGAANVYSAMKELESHLSDSRQFTYSLTNPPVPNNVDAVAWLLQTHKGYCTYYATAMTIMARILGIPARIVNGFSQGHYDSQRKMWVVNGDDAHSWVQVYFPKFGWINFDPTPGFSLNGSSNIQQPTPTPAGNHPPGRPTPAAGKHPKSGSQTALAHSSTGTGSDTTSQSAIARQNLFLALSLLILCGSVIVFVIALFRYRARNLLINTSVATAMFLRVCWLGSWAGLPPQRWQTPYEYNRVLSRRFPQVALSLRRVTEVFVRERWAAPHELPGAAEEQYLEKLWPDLRNAFFRLLFTRWSGRKKR